VLNKAAEDLFGKNIYHGKTGGEERKSCYRNLSRKDKREYSNNDSRQYTREENEAQVSGLPILKDTIPSNWVIVTDSPHRVSFVRMERWEFCNQRGCVDLLVAVDHEHSNNVSFTLRSHGNVVNLNDVMDFDNVLKDLTISGKVSTTIEFIEKSPICTGYFLSEEKEDIILLDPLATVGNFIEHSSASITTKCRKVFSKNCELFASPEGHCKKCKHRKVNQEKRKQYRKKETPSKRYCCYKYMTRQELVDQLRLERQNHTNLKRKYEYMKSGQEAIEDNDSEDDVGDQDSDIGDPDDATGGQGGATGDQGGATGDQGAESGGQDGATGGQGDATGDQGGATGDEADVGDADCNGEDDGNGLKVKTEMTGGNAMVISSRILYNIH
jgi:hypothetical protein